MKFKRATSRFTRQLLVGTALATAFTATASPASAAIAQESPGAGQFNIPAQNLGDALTQFARQSGQQLLFAPSLVAGKRSNALVGAFTPREGLMRLLSGSGIGFRTSPSGAYLLGNGAGPATSTAVIPDNADQDDTGNSEIVVTGTNIRGGAPIGSPLIRHSASEIAQSGAGTIEEFAARLPENFSSVSGPSATYSNVATRQNQAGSNSFAGAGFNIHGVGPQATLTLIDGQRVASAGGRGSFVDVNSIPVAAVERIDVLADGSSAIYGADAVAGVVNIVLRRDFEGALGSIRYSTTSDGGADQFIGTALGGHSWQTGNIMGAFEYSRQYRLLSTDRAYIPTQPRPVDLLPNNRTTNAVLALTQGLDPATSIHLSGFYSHREFAGLSGSAGLLLDRSGSTESRGGLAEFEHEFDNWRLRATASWFSNDQNLTQSFPQQPAIAPSFNSYNSAQWSVGLQADGRLVRIGNRDVRVAVGVGLRREDGEGRSGNSPFDLQRSVASVYGELVSPIIVNSSGRQDVLSATVAARYDDYSDFGSTTNWKLGLRFVPVEGFAIRASYGTSFRAPSLGELIPSELYYTVAIPNGMGGTTNTLLNMSTGLSPLEPETARTFNIGIDLLDAPIQGLRASISYYNVRYSDRIAAPPLQSGILGIYTQPISLEPYIIRNPPLSVVTAAFQSPAFLGDFAGAGPGGITAIFNGGFTNIARTKTSGIDGYLSYNRPFAGGNINASAWLTYIIDNEYTAAPGAIGLPLLNNVGGPVDFRARGMIGWSNRSTTVNASVNYVDGYQNTYFTPSRHISSWTTFDLYAAYQTPPDRRFLGGITISASIRNLFNERPPLVNAPTGTIFINIGYDATNADPFGRIFAIQLQKRF